MKIAFIGLGNMGAPMARNLLRAGHELIVYNRTRGKSEPLAAAGAHIADSSGDAVRDCEAVITMLANDAAVQETVFGQDGLLSSLAPGAVHLSTSTISVELSRHLAEAHAAADQGYIAAPVLGRPEAAEARKLWVIAAGPDEQVARCRPLLEALGRGVSVVGCEAWQANMVKIGANFVIASMIETLAEAAALMRKSDIPVQVFLDIVNQLFQSPVYANYGAIIAREEYQPAGFRMTLGLKDVGLALAAAAAQAVPLPLASLMRDHFLEGLARGYGDLDWSALARVLAEHAGLP